MIFVKNKQFNNLLNLFNDMRRNLVKTNHWRNVMQTWYLILFVLKPKTKRLSFFFLVKWEKSQNKTKIRAFFENYLNYSHKTAGNSHEEVLLKIEIPWKLPIKGVHVESSRLEAKNLKINSFPDTF